LKGENMQKYQVRNAENALAYITDCNLATVCSMAVKKSRNMYEFERQISIAQTAIDWMIEMHIDFSGTRVENVIKHGSVNEWVKTFIP